MKKNEKKEKLQGIIRQAFAGKEKDVVTKKIGVCK